MAWQKFTTPRLAHVVYFGFCELCLPTPPLKCSTMPQQRGVEGGRGYCGVVATVTVGNATAVKFNKIPISFGRTHTHAQLWQFQTLSVRSGCVSFRFVFTRIFSHSIFHLTFALASLLLCSCAHLIELQTLRSSQFSQLGRSQVEATVPAQLSLPFFAFSSHYSLTPLSLPLLLQATSL